MFIVYSVLQILKEIESFVYISPRIFCSVLYLFRFRFRGHVFKSLCIFPASKHLSAKQKLRQIVKIVEFLQSKLFSIFAKSLQISCYVG